MKTKRPKKIAPRTHKRKHQRQIKIADHVLMRELMLNLEEKLRLFAERVRSAQPSSPSPPPLPMPTVAGPHHPDRIIIFRNPSGLFAIEGTWRGHAVFQLLFETYEEARRVAVNMGRNLDALVLSARVSWTMLDGGEIMPMFGEIAPVYPINLARTPSRNLC